MALEIGKNNVGKVGQHSYAFSICRLTRRSSLMAEQNHNKTNTRKNQFNFPKTGIRTKTNISQSQNQNQTDLEIKTKTRTKTIIKSNPKLIVYESIQHSWQSLVSLIKSHKVKLNVTECLKRDGDHSPVYLLIKLVKPIKKKQ